MALEWIADYFLPDRQLSRRERGEAFVHCGSHQPLSFVATSLFVG
jgi:hypothetical protein